MARVVWLTLVLATIFVVLPTTGNAQSSDSVDPVVGWLRGRARPLASPGAASRSSDLEPLRDVLKDVQVVGLGESTHGTREFFQFKRRIVQFLVSELGFTVVAIESGLADMEPLNDYVLHGRGTLTDALEAQGYIAYINEDFVALLEWLRAHNRRVPLERRVQVVGLDIMTNTRGRARVLDYLRAHHPERVPEVEGVFRILAEEQDKTPLSFSRDRLASVLPQVRALHDFLAAERDRLAGTDAAAQLDALVGYMRLMDYWSTGGKRAQAMGLNVSDILSQSPGVKVIAWAANGHIARGSGGRSSIGTEVSKVVGPARYYAIAFEFGQGSARVRPPDALGKLGPLQQLEVPAVPAGSLPRQLSQAMGRDFFVDLRGGRTSVIAKWMAEPILTHAVAWNQQRTNPTAANDTVGDYDGLLFVHRSAPARPTKSGKELAAKGHGI